MYLYVCMYVKLTGKDEKNAGGFLIQSFGESLFINMYMNVCMYVMISYYYESAVELYWGR
jgi:hypothetical protein